MAEEDVLAAEADQEVENQQETEGQEAQTAKETPDAEKADTEGAETPNETDSEEKKTRETAKERRERDKAYKARLREERETALERAQKAEDRRARILDAKNSETAPKEGDFEDYTEYVAAKAVWKHAQGATEREAGQASEEAEAARQEAEQVEQQEKALIYQNWQEAAAEARTRYADFDAVISNPNVPIPKGVAELVQSSEYAGDVAYRIASNPDLASEIAKMPPIEAARAIGRIEAAVTAPKPRTSSTAPEPISPVKATPQAQRDPAKMSYAEYKKWRMGK